MHWHCFCFVSLMFFRCFPLSSNLLSQSAPPRTRWLMLKTKTLNYDRVYVNIFQYFSLNNDSFYVFSSLSGLLFSGDNWIFCLLHVHTEEFESFLSLFSRCFLLSSNLLSRGSPPRTQCCCLMLKTKTLNYDSVYVNIFHHFSLN